MPVISIPKALRDRPQLAEPLYGSTAIRQYGITAMIRTPGSTEYSIQP
jgi:hypothetical protein